MYSLTCNTCKTVTEHSHVGHFTAGRGSSMAEASL